jgi:hypothetical protein
MRRRPGLMLCDVPSASVLLAAMHLVVGVQQHWCSYLPPLKAVSKSWSGLIADRLKVESQALPID